MTSIIVFHVLKMHLLKQWFNKLLSLKNCKNKEKDLFFFFINLAEESVGPDQKETKNSSFVNFCQSLILNRFWLKNFRQNQI